MSYLQNLGPADALLRIDLQNDFMVGGALEVPGARAELVHACNRLARHFRVRGGVVVDTQDYHPAGHSSFASSHAGKQPFSVVQMPYGPQVLWPDHCVQGTVGAQLHALVDGSLPHLVLRKGMNPAVDSYSAFYENDKVTPTGLAGYLRERKVQRVWVCGLAMDYCVAYTALDAGAVCHFESTVLLDYSLPINAESAAQLQNKLTAHGVRATRD